MLPGPLPLVKEGGAWGQGYIPHNRLHRMSQVHVQHVRPPGTGVEYTQYSYSHIHFGR